MPHSFTVIAVSNLRICSFCLQATIVAYLKQLSWNFVRSTTFQGQNNVIRVLLQVCWFGSVSLLLKRL